MIKTVLVPLVDGHVQLAEAIELLREVEAFDDSVTDLYLIGVPMLEIVYISKQKVIDALIAIVRPNRKTP